MIAYKKLPKIVFLYIVFLALFSRYFEHYYIWKILFLLLSVPLCLTNFAFRKKIIYLFCNPYSFLLLSLIILNFILVDERSFFLYNLNLLIWPVLFVLTLVSIFLISHQKVEVWIAELFLPLNIMLVLNIIVTWFQCLGIPIFIRNSWLSMNSYYPDLCCGFFGYNGTHELNIFLLFMNAFNFHFIKTKNTHKKALTIYIILLDLMIIYISTKNDNISMFILLPLFVFVYFIMSEYMRRKKIIALVNKFGKYIILLFILVTFVLAVPNIREFINEYVFIRIRMVFDIANNIYQINGSNERLAIVLASLENKSGWILGTGIGSASYGGGSFFGFNHFGLSSIGTLIMTGGIWFYIVFSLFYANIIAKTTNTKSVFLRFICFLLIVILTIQTIFYTSFVTTIWYTMYFRIIMLEKTDICTATYNKST